MKTIIVYYSMAGNTAYTAERTAQALHADLLELKPVKAYPDKGFRKFLWGGKSAVMAEKPKLMPYTFHADQYEQVVIGFPVWASRMAPPLRTFVEENKTVLQDKSIAVFACQAGSGADKAFQKLRSLLSIPAFTAEMILIDPKEKPDEMNEQTIRKFCDKLK